MSGSVESDAAPLMEQFALGSSLLVFRIAIDRGSDREFVAKRARAKDVITKVITETSKSRISVRIDRFSADVLTYDRPRDNLHPLTKILTSIILAIPFESRR